MKKEKAEMKKEVTELFNIYESEINQLKKIIKVKGKELRKSEQ